MFAAISRLTRSAKAKPKTTAKGIELMLSLVADTVGGGIAGAKDFEKLMIPAIESVNAYFAGQIASIPGPLDISLQAFGKHPATAIVFPETGEIIRALGRSLEVKDSLPQLATTPGAYVHALLGVRRKTLAGAGESFADHTIRSLAPTLSDAREYVAFAAFKRILNDFTEHVNKLRRRDHLLKVEWNIQNEVVDNVSAADSMEYISAQELTPEKLVAGLIGWLAAPAKYLRLEASGVFLPAGTASVQPELPMLHCSDRRQWLVCLVRFPVAEGLRALEEETHHHRHIFI